MTTPRKRTPKPNLGGRMRMCSDGVARLLVDWEGADILATITKADIRGARPGDCQNCVGTRAFQRVITAQWRRPVEVLISNSKVQILDYEKNCIWRLTLPGNERAMIRAFDTQKYLPLGYTMRITQVIPSERLGARNKARGQKKHGAPHNRTRALPTRGSGFYKFPHKPQGQVA